MEREKKLLGIEDIRREYKLGRSTAYGLLALLPVVRVGRRLLIRRSDLEAYLEQAACEKRDIRAEAMAAYKRKTPAGQGGAR